MKKILIPLILLYLFYDAGLFAQPLSRSDSVFRYLQQFKGINYTDSMLLEKTMKAIFNTVKDSLSFEKINSELKRLFPFIQRQNYLTLKTAMGIALSSDNDFDLAINYNKNLITELYGNSDKFSKNLMLYLLGELRLPYRNSSRIQEGIGYYQRLASDYEQVNDSDATSVCCHVLSTFYRTLGLHDKTIYYTMKSTVLLNPRKIVTSYDFLMSRFSLIGVIGYISRKSVLGNTLIENEEPEKAMPYLYEAKNIFESIKNTVKVHEGPYIYLNISRVKMLTGSDSVFYYFNLMKKSLDSLNDLNYPNYISVYYQTLGYYCYLRNRLDSAENLIQQSTIIKDSYKLLYNSRFGSLIPGYFLALIKIRQQKYPEAIMLLKNESNELLKINLRRIALKEMMLLSTAFKLNGDLQNSNSTLEQYIQLQKEIIADEYRSRFISFETEQQINSLNAEKKKQQQEASRQKSIRNWVTGGLAVVFIFSLIFLFQRIRIAKEKRRSEALLLNILPYETARELKEKGKSEARMFEEVTVMFTDFKGFTQISEKLSPAELVAEIDTCFKAFDEIITKYNIEKIKTIGDSYMCAGGLPVPNKTNAADVINAGLEIRDFMFRRRSENSNPGFEIRIGVHTGPVIAGIVGNKKFAYDIWGDTVNVASRMESSGEAGKVNISNTSYELVKDQFKCIGRGKIQAKYKGEIDMYFVEKVKTS